MPSDADVARHAPKKKARYAKNRWYIDTNEIMRFQENG